MSTPLGSPIQSPSMQGLTPTHAPAVDGMQLSPIPPLNDPMECLAPERQQSMPNVAITSMKPFQPHENYTTAAATLPASCPGGAIESKVVSDLVKNLKTYNTSENHVEASMKAFINDHLEQLGVASATPKIIEGGGVWGASGAPVFRVLGENGSLVAIAKGFLNANELAQEMRAEGLLKGFSLQHSQVPQGLGVGSCFARGEAYYLMLQTVAPGKPLHQHLDAVGKSEDRELSMQVATTAVRQTATALAELHTLHTADRASDASVKLMTADLISQLSKVKINLKNASLPGVDFKDLKSPNPVIADRVTAFVNHTSDKFKANPGPGAILHGDAHPGNFFYDASNNALTMIDLPSSSRSCDGEKGLMSAAWDSQMFKFRIAESMVRADQGTLLEGLTKEEVRHLEKTFDEAYAAAGGAALLTPESMQFAKLNRVLTSLVQLSTQLKSFPSNEAPERGMIINMIAYRMEMLTDMMQGFEAPKGPAVSSATNEDRMQPTMPFPSRRGPIAPRGRGS